MTVSDYVSEHFDRFVDELMSFLRIPSISTNEAYHGAIQDAAGFVQESFRVLGATDVQLFKTAGHPVVYGAFIQDPALPTVLCYGHYDVQPSEPDQLWDKPPFEPYIQDGQLIARGASDDKGQIFCHFKAVEALLKTRGALPVNVKFLIEGEEEIGSVHLLEVLRAQKERLKADALLVSDTPMYAKDQPSLCLSLRGLVYMELSLETASTDMHSGQHGGAVPNAIEGVTRLLGQLKDSDGRVMIPGFYDDVQELDEVREQALSEMMFDDEAYEKELGLSGVTGEQGFSTLARRWYRPTLDCNGIWGGYTGPGAKTVIPARAHAKVSMRLVANQDPDKIVSAFKAYVSGLCPRGARVSVSCHSSAPALTVPMDHGATQSARDALSDVFEKPVFLQGEGGSIPILTDFQKELGLSPVLMGFNLPEDRIHAPNEQFALDNFKRGILATATFFDRFSQSHV